MEPLLDVAEIEKSVWNERWLAGKYQDKED